MDLKAYLQASARKLDVRLYEYLFEGARPQPVLDELARYQNEDGGFGHGLEPDLQMPGSSPLATTTALQYLARVNVNQNELTNGAVRYLLNSYDAAKQRWINIPPEADNYPRAPWWNYQDVLGWAGWGNPSAEVLGYLLQHADKADPDFLTQLTRQALGRLDEITEPEQHEIKCYIRLYEHASKELQAQLYDKVAAHIKQTTKTDPKDWQGYTATPLTFIESPESPFANLFDSQLLQKNAEYLKMQLINGSHWEPSWQWGQFEQEWQQAKQDWAGKLTVENAALLQAFGA